MSVPDALVPRPRSGSRWKPRRAAGIALALGLAAAAPATAAASAPTAAASAPTASSPARIVRLQLDVALDPEAGTLAETARVTVAAEGATRLLFALDESLAVEAVTPSEGVAEPRRAGSGVEVTLDPPVHGTRTLAFRIGGRLLRDGKPRIAPAGVVLGPADGFYPRLPDVWAEAEVAVRVPDGWRAFAPGTPAGVGGFRFRPQRPVRSLALAAGPGWTITEGLAVKVPVRVVGPAPLAGGEAGRHALELLGDPMAWLAGTLGPYPFDGFLLVRSPGLTADVRASGMAAVDEARPLARWPDAAEVLAGQWWGERIAGDGTWIEAWESWQAWAYARDRALVPPARLEALRAAYFELPRAADVPLTRADATTPISVRRGKGSAAPAMVELMAGTRAFREGIGDLFAAPPGPPIALDDVRRAMEARLGASLAVPFAQWFGRADVPELEARLRTFPAASGGTRVDLTVIQTRAAYQIPVEVRLVGPGTEHRETLELRDERTELVYTLPFTPLRVEVDPQGRIFRWPGPPAP